MQSVTKKLSRLSPTRRDEPGGADGGSIRLAQTETGAAFVLVLATAPIAANMTA